jgi:hypothetical protein
VDAEKKRLKREITEMMAKAFARPQRRPLRDVLAEEREETAALR